MPATLPQRLELAHLPTPVHKLERVSREVGLDLYIWRDDLTGFVESGNKIRKLEFLLAEAISKDATRIITCGGLQSNHTRATAFLSRRLGLEVTIVVREPAEGLSPTEPPTGNYLLNLICGADLKFISYANYEAHGGRYDRFLEEEAKDARGRGEIPYLVPEGGSCPLGCFGYLRGVEEMLAAWRKTEAGTDAPDSLFFAIGSGGTYAGLHLGYQASGLSTRGLWGINVCDSREFFERTVGELLGQTCREYGLPYQDRTLQILDGHMGEGYGAASDDDLRAYARIARQEGILLDPVYTGKAFLGMLREIAKDPTRFGKKILFLHSGGGFENFVYQRQYGQILTPP